MKPRETEISKRLDYLVKQNSTVVCQMLTDYLKEAYKQSCYHKHNVLGHIINYKMIQKHYWEDYVGIKDSYVVHKPTDKPRLFIESSMSDGTKYVCSYKKFKQFVKHHTIKTNRYKELIYGRKED